MATKKDAAHTDVDQKFEAVRVTSQPHGGYLVCDGGNFQEAAFSDKAELLAWLANNLR